MEKRREAFVRRSGMIYVEVSGRERGLGFRDIEVFNMALLAKKGWRLIQNPHSVLAQALKAKYHPGFSFLEAPLLPYASYV